MEWAAKVPIIVLLLALATSYQMITYFIVLLSAMCYCYSRPVGMERKVASALCVLVTWFYIIRFMARYDGTMNSFDAAYADVIWGGDSGNWKSTQMLLAWAAVAMVWTAEESAFHQLFGVFGAMSASYLLAEPERHPKATVPLHYAVFSVLAFACIVALPLTTTVAGLSWALWALHVCLLAPKFVPLDVPVDRCSLYVILALLSFVVHASAGRGVWPDTDCRVSITIDAVVCACVTLASIFRRTGSSSAAIIWGSLVPMISPGAVLGIYSACELGLEGWLVTCVQELTASQLRKRSAASDADGKWASSSWMNLGLWRETEHYDTACRQLAKAVGDAAGLGGKDRVLCLACGHGDELNYFAALYGPARVVGLDSNARAAAGFKPAEAGVELLAGDAGDIARGRRLFRRGDFDKAVAVDSAYHCDKQQLFEDCARLLPRGGAVALTDVLLRPGAPGWLRALLRLCGIRAANQWTEAEYGERLKAAGLELTRLESLEPFVLARWLPRAVCRHLDYALVSARVPEAAARPKAAIIGSGLSGLVAAYLLDPTHDVTIFEARDVPGFAGGEARLPTGAVIDIPLRMIEPHYWRSVVELCGELKVPMVDTRFTVSIYGNDDPGLKTDESLLRSVVGNLGHYLRVLASAARLHFTPARAGETLLDFVSRVGLADSRFYRVYVRRHLSWVLSCTYDMVDSYPAELVVGFFRAIQGNYFRQKGPTMRIDPSVKRLEDALLLGKSIRTAHPVQPFREGRAVDGQEFDAVVIATEAQVVPKLLPHDWAGVFGEFQYHPSHVVVHRDPSLMPEDRSLWRAVNVCDDAAGEACQITVWVNAFYASADLGGDVFETVNPVRQPDKALLIREVHLQRVVHTAASARLQARIAELQGRDGFYFCGAYSVPGMGLLEQATLSARRAAEAVERDRRARAGA